jgi:hypothetical protein
VEAKHIQDYQVWIKFDDGKSGKINLIDEIWGEVFEPLKDINYFRNFKIENDTLSWENEADLAPDFLYELLNQQTKK